MVNNLKILLLLIIINHCNHDDDIMCSMKSTSGDEGLRVGADYFSSILGTRDRFTNGWQVVLQFVVGHLQHGTTYYNNNEY